MAFEFIAKNGLVSLGNASISGTLSARTITSSFSGSVFGTASYAVSASFAPSQPSSVAVSASFASSSLTASVGVKAWAHMTFNGTTLVSNTFGCTVKRTALGIYPILFNVSAPNTNYSVQFTGWSGSAQTAPTMSIGAQVSMTTTGFTMSVVKASAAVPPVADFNTGSIVISSY